MRTIGLDRLTKAKRKVDEFLYQRKYKADVKKIVIQAYGGQCACCSIKTIEFLTIDHMKGDGQEDRKRNKDFYRYIIKAGFPQDRGYQILCMNCNWAVRFGTQCPHERNRRKHYEFKMIRKSRSANNSVNNQGIVQDLQMTGTE